MKKYLKIITIVIAIIVVIVGYFFVFAKDEKISYMTITVQRGKISQEVNATGEVVPMQLVTVGAQVSGQIEKLHVQLGQDIRKGDPIAQIDSTTQQNSYDIELAKLESYQAQLEAAQVQLNVAKEQYARETKLYATHATSKADLDTAEGSYANAKSTIAELNSHIVQTKIALNNATVNLGYTKIVSPLDGTIVSVPVEEGQTVNAAMSTPTIVQIADLDQMKILMEISEGDVDKVQPGMSVTYSILSEPDDIFTTKLKSIDPGLTTLTNGGYEQGSSTNTAIYYYGRLEVPNDQRTLRIGMTTQNTINIAQRDNALIIPSTTIHERNGQKMVTVLIDDNKTVEKPIVTGLSDDINTEIVSGLQEGECVVISHMSTTQINNSMNMTRMPRM